MNIIGNLEECIMRKLKLHSITLTTAALTLSLNALDINSAEANEITHKPASTVEIVSTEMNQSTNDTPSIERPTTEARTIETPTTEGKSAEKMIVTSQTNETNNKVTEKPAKESANTTSTTTKPATNNQTLKPSVGAPVTTERPTTEQPVKVPGPVTQPTEPVTTEKPNVPTDNNIGTNPSTPGTPSQPGIPSTGGGDDTRVPPAPKPPVDESKDEDKHEYTEKPGKFSPAKGEAYYTALDKHVGELVTTKIEKSKDIDDATQTEDLVADKKDNKASNETDTSKQTKSTKDKQKDSDKEKQSKKEKDQIKALPDTGEVTSLFGYIAALLLAGSVLVRKK